MNDRWTKEGFPWPIGSHWCWYETVIWTVAVIKLVALGAVLLLFGTRPYLTIPFGATLVVGGLALWRVVQAKVSP